MASEPFFLSQGKRRLERFACRWMHYRRVLLLKSTHRAFQKSIPIFAPCCKASSSTRPQTYFRDLDGVTGWVADVNGIGAVVPTEIEVDL